MEDGGGAAVALEDCGGRVVLRGEVGRWFMIAVAALDGGGGRRTCNFCRPIILCTAQEYFWRT